VPGGNLGEFVNENPQLFLCVDYDAPMTVYAYNCINATGMCGGGWGVPEVMIPAYYFTLTTWDNFGDGVEVTLQGGNGDPRQLILIFNYGPRGTTSPGVIIGAILVILAILAIVVGGVYWWQRKQNIAYHKANSQGVDRV